MGHEFGGSCGGSRPLARAAPHNPPSFCDNETMFRRLLFSGFIASGLLAQPTFHKDVEPIMQAKCQQCHRPNDIAPFALLTYDDASTYAADINCRCPRK